MPVDHERLVAVELESVAGTHRLHLGLQRAMFCALVDGERGEQRTVGDLRQMLRPSARRCRRATARTPPARRSTETATASGCGRSPPSPRRPRRSRDPLPPNSSGTSRPENPISAKVFQSSRENPVASLASRSCRRCDTGALSLMRPRALSRSIDCSSVRTRAMLRCSGSECSDAIVELVVPGRRRSVEPGTYEIPGSTLRAPRNDGWRTSRPRQIENPFGHDAEHHLAECRPRSSWPWCAARRAAGRRLWSARFPIPARRRRPPTSGFRSGACSARCRNISSPRKTPDAPGRPWPDRPRVRRRRPAPPRRSRRSRSGRAASDLPAGPARRCRRSRRRPGRAAGRRRARPCPRSSRARAAADISRHPSRD